MANSLTPAEISQILDEFFNVVGTRQYIGARYVPIFGRKGEESIVWDNSKPYEPLTIVLYQGNSYTSRQYVPTGVDITNVEYWAETGNYNAQVEQYRQEVLSFDSRITAVENVYDEIDSYLEASFEANNANTLWHGKNVLCVTDSWGRENSYGVTKCWMHIFCDAMGANYIDLAQGSTGYTEPPSPTGGRKNFITRLQDYVAAHTEDELKSIAAVIISGSSNDHNYVITTAQRTSYMAQVVATWNYILTNFPNATIYAVPQIATPNMLTMSVNTETNIWSYLGAVPELALLLNVSNLATQRIVVPKSSPYWLYTCRSSTIATIMNDDHIHPKQQGHYIIARKMFEWVTGQVFNFVGYDDGTSGINAQLAFGRKNATTGVIEDLQINRGYTKMVINDTCLSLESRVTIPYNLVQDNEIICFGIKRFLPVNIEPTINKYWGNVVLTGQTTGKCTVYPIIVNTLIESYKQVASSDTDLCAKFLEMYPFSFTHFKEFFSGDPYVLASISIEQELAYTFGR